MGYITINSISLLFFICIIYEYSTLFITYFLRTNSRYFMPANGNVLAREGLFGRPCPANTRQTPFPNFSAAPP